MSKKLDFFLIKAKLKLNLKMKIFFQTQIILKEYFHVIKRITIICEFKL